MDDDLGYRRTAGIAGVGAGVSGRGTSHQEIGGGPWTHLRNHANTSSLAVVADHL